MTAIDSVMAKLDKYSDSVRAQSADFERRIKALEAPDTRDAIISIGKRAKLSAEARDAFYGFVRRAGQSEHLHHYLGASASMTSSEDPSGGATVLPEIDYAIRELSREISPLRSVATVRTISGDSLRLTVESGALPAAAWVGEQEARPVTVGSTFGVIDIPVCEAYSSPAVSQSLLDDSSFQIVDFLIGRIALALTTLEGAAFINGDGFKKPRGLMNYPTSASDDGTRDNLSFQYIPTGAGGTPTTAQLAAALISASEKLKAEFAGPGCCWLMSRATRAFCRTMVYSSSDSRLLWTPSGGGSSGYTDKRPDELLGYPIVTMPDMDPLSKANGYPIAFGDIGSAYTIVDRKGITMQKDIYTQKGFAIFYTTKRMGGGASGGTGFQAVKFVKNAAS